MNSVAVKKGLARAAREPLGAREGMCAHDDGVWGRAHLRLGMRIDERARRDDPIYDTMRYALVLVRRQDQGQGVDVQRKQSKVGRTSGSGVWSAQRSDCCCRVVI